MTIEEAIKESRERAKEYIKKNGESSLEMRSCWNCNVAHEHLRNHKLIWCYECGHYFWNGIDITETDNGGIT